MYGEVLNCLQGHPCRFAPGSLNWLGLVQKLLDFSPMLTFASAQARQHAESLMQPALIRVLDNLRKRMETSPWQGKYREHLLWPETATDAQKQRVMELRAQMDGAEAGQLEQIQAELARLPVPYPGYELHLYSDAGSNPDAEAEPDTVIDVWRLCCRACFVDFDADSSQPVTVDSALLEADGEVDWLTLDEKVVELIDGVFPVTNATEGPETNLPQ